MTDNQPKKRGIIIVNYDVLENLGVKIKNSFKTHRDGIDSGIIGKRYLKVLLFLADNGFEIVIPEEVAFKSGFVLRSGKCTDDYFSHSRADKKARSTFLKDVVSGRFPNIHIVRTLPEDGYNPYQALEDLINSCEGKIDTNLRRSIDAIQQHTGESQAFEGVKRALHARAKKPTKDRVPLFVLSEDLNFLGDLCHQPDMNFSILNTYGLMEALDMYELHTHPQIGIKGEYYAKDLVMDMRIDRKLGAGGNYRAIDQTRRSFLDDEPFPDRSLAPLLETLKKDLHFSPPPEEPDNGPGGLSEKIDDDRPPRPRGGGKFSDGGSRRR